MHYQIVDLQGSRALIHSDLLKLSYKKERDNLLLKVHSWITQLDRVFGMSHGIFDHDVLPVADKILLFPVRK